MNFNDSLGGGRGPDFVCVRNSESCVGGTEERTQRAEDSDQRTQRNGLGFKVNITRSREGAEKKVEA